MHLIRSTSAVALLLIAGAVGVLSAQEKEGQGKPPEKQESKAPQQQQRAQPAQQKQGRPSSTRATCPTSAAESRACAAETSATETAHSTGAADGRTCATEASATDTSPLNRRSGRPNLHGRTGAQKQARNRRKRSGGRTGAAEADGSQQQHAHRLNRRSSEPRRRSVRSRPRNSSNRSAASSKRPHGNKGRAGRRRAHGRRTTRGWRTAVNGGTATIATGRNGEAMAAPTFPRPALTSLLEWTLVPHEQYSHDVRWGIRASHTAGIRSCWWIPFPDTGLPTGMTPITSTSHITTGTTFTTAGIRVLGWQSLSCFSRAPQRAQACCALRC